MNHQPFDFAKYAYPTVADTIILAFNFVGAINILHRPDMSVAPQLISAGLMVLVMWMHSCGMIARYQRTVLLYHTKSVADALAITRVRLWRHWLAVALYRDPYALYDFDAGSPPDGD